MQVHLSPGTAGWWAVAAVVVAYDTWALARERETLSAAFRDSVEHRGWRWLVLPLWLVTSLHLFGKLPRQIDPFVGYGVVLAQVRGGRGSLLDGPAPRV